MALQFAKPLGSKKVQEMGLLAGIPKGAQPLGGNREFRLHNFIPRAGANG
jgi:hypothetical protein